VFDMDFIIHRYGIMNRVIYTGMKYFKGVQHREMNEIYNLMDVFFLSTSGEGFGIPTIEAAACGVPSVVTDYTTTHELLIEDGQCGIPVPVVAEIIGSWGVERGVMDIVKAAEALKHIRDNPEVGKAMGKVGVKKVKKIYTWDTVGDQWNKLLREVVENR